MTHDIINISLFRKNLFLLLIIIATLLSFSVEAKTSSKQVVDSVLTKILQYPESISSYTIEELTKDMDRERVSQWCNIIISLKANGIRRDVIKRYYIPLCRCIMESYYHESELLHEMAHKRSFSSNIMTQVDSAISGREIVSRFTEYQRVCKIMKEVPWEKLIVPTNYCNMRMLEWFIWGDNSYMDKLDPIPNKLIADIGSLFGVEITLLEENLPTLLQTHNNDCEFLINQSALLIEASTFLSQYQMLMVVGTVSAAYISQGKTQELLNLMNSIFSKRWGNILWNKLKPIITYQITGTLEIEKVKTFHCYRDSLMSKHIGFAKYYPYQCPENMKRSSTYEEYNNKYYDALDYIFTVFIKSSSVSQLSFGSQLFNNLGCGSQEEFLRIYTEETLRRYFDNDDFLMWGKIEKIREYIENASKYPIDVALHILECYAPINALKARDFIRKTSLDAWIDKQITFPQQNVDDLKLRTASVIAYVYASLYNEARYPTILKYVEWVEKNIKLTKTDIDGIVYNVASALALMDEHKESNVWISRVQVDKSKYRQEFYGLLLENHCELDNTKEVVKIASKMVSFSYMDILRLFIAKLNEDSVYEIDEIYKYFTSSLSKDFNLFAFMNMDDQEWLSRVTKYRTLNLLMNLDVSLWVKEESKKTHFLPLIKQYIAAMRYNWALASKGARLRSNKYMKEMILNEMPSEQYDYFRQALAFEEEDYDEDNIERRLDAFVSQQVNDILLDYVRRDTAHVLPQFDYNKVRSQLQVGDIAIELVRFDYDIFDIIMIRNDWEFPKIETLIRSDKDDNCVKLWSTLMPYLTEVERIFISLDGDFHFENIEYATDSTGTFWADKYDIRRVSTTLYIPKDVYLSDIKQSVIYGNLNYAKPKDLDEVKVPIENKKRGAILDHWEPLEETKEEIKHISKIMNSQGIKHKEYQGEDGDKDSFMSLNKQRIELLHLATHGFYSGVDVVDEEETSAMKRSGIVLSNSTFDLSYTKQSGTIFANEVANMDLSSVKLLVLSACETARGNLGDDGVFGLQRGFKQAGVGCIIMSLNKVNNVMTNELMQLFYSFFAKGQTARLAFHNAQKQIASKYNLEDWKHFIIID